MTPATTAGSRRVVLVIGASRGIGAAIATAFVATGAQVVLAARDGVALARVAARVGSAAGAPSTLTRPVDPQAFVILLHGASLLRVASGCYNVMEA